MPDGTISDTGMNSLNHYAYGSVMEFVYAYAAGIRPLEAGFGKLQSHRIRMCVFRKSHAVMILSAVVMYVTGKLKKMEHLQFMLKFRLIVKQ